MRRSYLLFLVAGLFVVSALACDSNTVAPGGGDGTGILDGNGYADWNGGGDVFIKGDAPFQQCTAVTETADNKYQPVDVIFAIDNSKSMGDEIVEVQTNMNRFSKLVSDRNLDMRVILISCLPGQCDHSNSHGICIDPPLGKQGGCTASPAKDANPPGYTHVNERVPSQKGLEWIVREYASYKAMLRPDAVRHIVVVSDDTELWTASQFETELLKADPKFAGYTFHAVFAYQSKEAACTIGKTTPCCLYAAPGGEGTVYRELVKKTGGVSSDLCDQDFDPLFTALGNAVIGSAKLSCDWTIPPPPKGETLDPKKVNVVFVDGKGASNTIGKVNAASDCTKVTHGWYYDNATKPTKVLVCPQTCTWIQADTKAKIDIQFGCETHLAPIL